MPSQYSLIALVLASPYSRIALVLASSFISFVLTFLTSLLLSALPFINVPPPSSKMIKNPLSFLLCLQKGCATYV